MDSMAFYDEDDYMDQCQDHVEQDVDQEYEYEYEQETLTELYDLCVKPTFLQTAEYFIPLLGASLLYKIISQCSFIPQKLIHFCSIVIGFLILHHYVPESLHLLTIFIVASFIHLHLPKKYRRGFGVFIPSIFIILYCEFYLEPVSWHKIRGVLMIAVMKEISVTIDYNETDEKPMFWEYFGYLLCPVTSIFGPWTTFKDYTEDRRQESLNLRWIFKVIGYFSLGLVCLNVSNCGTNWIISDDSGKWSLAYRDALSFRMSHYFISNMASSFLLLGGFSSNLSSITKPIEIEFPRSLVQVVISWNIPMHTWLKIYIFRPGRREFGKFGGILLTYLASSLLHGFNFQLAAVLLSLGFYTYIEFQLRAVLSTTFNACISSKKCPNNQCQHEKNSSNSWWVIGVNIAFSILAMFHLAYLGLMFDTSETQEVGYSYLHTLEKWSKLGFASHWIVFATYCAYFLIR